MAIANIQKLSAPLLDYMRRSRPIGMAFAIAVALNVTVLSIAMLAAPVQVSTDFYFSESPLDVPAIIPDPQTEALSITHEFSDCYWMPLDDAKAVQVIEEKAISPVARVRCMVPDPLEEPGSPRSATALAEKFDAAPGWQRAVTTLRVDKLPPGRESFFWVAILLIPSSFLLLRGLDLRNDLKRACSAGLRRPWLLLYAPVAAITISLLGSILIPQDPVKQEHIVEVLAFFSLSAWLIVLVLPFVEEAVFRQWLYIRIINLLPVWVAALASSWAFMLLHLFNPQVTALALYLPTILAVGLIMFWLRHRYQSFLLAAAAHVFHNGFLLGIAALHHG